VRNVNVDQPNVEIAVKEEVHHLIIGATGSGKTQRVIIPTI
jgi:DNA segregation ATPase FtsK/SpoIIIE-like protein